MESYSFFLFLFVDKTTYNMPFIINVVVSSVVAFSLACYMIVT